MKFKNILFTLMMFVLFIGNVNAVEEIFSCVYKNNSEEITVKLFTDYKFEVTTNFITEGWVETGVVAGRPQGYTVEQTNDLQYNYFINENDNKFKCADQIYINGIEKTVADRTGSKTTRTHNISVNKQDKKNESSSTGGGGTLTTYEESVPYKNDSNASKIYIESPTEADNKEGWLKTCTYDNKVIIRYNKETLELVKTPKSEYVTNISVDTGSEFWEKLENYGYACPISVCANGHSALYQSYNFYFDYSMVGKSGCYSGAEYSDSKYSCVGIAQYYSKFIDYHNKYQETKLIDYINMANQNKTYLISFCNSVIENSDYDGIDKCVKQCFEVKEEIEQILNITDNQVCGFSERLGAWIVNIFKWVKYILPVIVIILSILDFIKAIGADKDDEMKKAQGKFIRRLIAAALVFIVPLILEFVLVKMGFGYDSCSLF